MKRVVAVRANMHFVSSRELEILRIGKSVHFQFDLGAVARGTPEKFCVARNRPTLAHAPDRGRIGGSCLVTPGGRALQFRLDRLDDPAGQIRILDRGRRGWRGFAKPVSNRRDRHSVGKDRIGLNVKVITQLDHGAELDDNRHRSISNTRITVPLDDDVDDRQDDVVLLDTVGILPVEIVDDRALVAKNRGHSLTPGVCLCQVQPTRPGAMTAMTLSPVRHSADCAVRLRHRRPVAAHGQDDVGCKLGEAYHNYVDDSGKYDDDNPGAFGDSGRFGAVAQTTNPINWPTVLVSAAVAAIVSSLFLALGVVGMHRSGDSPTEVVVAVDPQGAVSVDGQPVTEEGAVALSSSSDLPPGTTLPGTSTSRPGASARAGDGGGLSPATGVAPAPSSVPAPGGTVSRSGGTSGDESGGAAPGGDAPAPAPAEAAPAPAEPGPAEGERVTGWTPPRPLPADFAVTTDDPTLDDLNAIVHLLVATPAGDDAKARNLEAGMGGVVVPQTVYNLGIFRAPQGWKRITGPIEHAGDRITATLHSESVGRPSIRTRVVFVKRDGNWKLSTQSVCEGVRTVGLPIACGG